MSALLKSSIETTTARISMSARATQLDAVRRRRRLRAVAAVTAAVSAGAVGSAAAAPASSLNHAGQTITVYAFSIGGPFIPVPGTNPKALSQGDETVVNDQLTVTHKRNGGYPIIGRDSGTCTFTRVANPREGLADCVATAVLRAGSLTAQGVVEISSAGEPRPAELAITGGTGTYAGDRGTLRERVHGNHEIFTITLQ
jgi:hypothetical protein